MSDITEEKLRHAPHSGLQVEKPEESLEEFLFYRNCLDKAAISIFQSDENGTIFYANEFACAGLGYTMEELRSLSVFDIDPAVTPEKMIELKRILDAKGSVTHESIHQRKDGTSFPVEITVNHLEFQGKVYGISFVKDITERKRAEEERRKSEANFSVIFQATPDLIAITRAGDGTILEVNEAFTRLLGYSRPEAVGKTTGELSIWTDPADRARWMAALEATGHVDEFETTLRCRDGSLVTCVSTARPLDFRGEKCVLSVVRDITERKRAEEELLLTQFCVDKASLALYQLTMEGDICNVNEYTCQSLGYSMEELRSMTVFDIDPTVTREVYNDFASRMLSCGSITFERTHRRKDGTTFPVEITANFLEFGGRKFGICFVKDIAERKLVEKALRENEERLRFTQYAIEKTIDQAFWMTEEGRLFYVNDAACRALAYTREELLRMSIPDIDPIYQPEKFAEHWRDLQENGYATFETLHRTKDGRVYPVEIRANFVVFDGKEYNCAFATDISDRKLAEDELRKALDATNSANTTMRRLLRTVAHEFRTPLGLLMGSADILDRYWDRMAPEKRLEQNKHIRNAAHQISDLVDSVTSFNQLETDRPGNLRQLLNIGDLCRSIAAEVETVWCAGHEFILSLAADCGTAVIDDILFRRILQNLLTNAFRYTPSDGTVSLKVRRRNNRLFLEITDTGIGIPEEDQALIFDPFYRSRNIEGRRGLGLGLSIVRESLPQMGGTITVTSSTGKGTAMLVKIPVVDPV